jgi:hypothetical protein
MAMQSTYRLVTAAALAVVLALAAAGCGGHGIPREPVSGKVTLDGSPLDNGLITFTPEDNTRPPAGTAITDGSYRMGRADGPAPGPHTVTISSRKPTGKKLKSADFPGTFVEETRESIPPQYNVDSRLGIEVKRGGENRFDFDLSSGTAASKAKPKPKP